VEVPISATAGRLSALDPYTGFDVGTELGTGWLMLAAVEADGDLDRWLDDLVALHGRRNVAGSLLGADLARAVVGPGVSAIVLEERCPDPALDKLAIRRHPEEDYLDRCAVLRPGMAVPCLRSA
jgi:hypothetical protein